MCFIFQVAVNATGWIGFGPTATGSMIGGNPCVVMMQNGSIVAISMHSENMSTPTVNTHNNCRLIEFNTLNGESYARVERPVYGCPPEDQDISEYILQRWIAAWGFDVNIFSYHRTQDRSTWFFNAFEGEGAKHILRCSSATLLPRRIDPLLQQQR